MDAHLILQILSLCFGVFVAFVSLRVKVAVGKLSKTCKWQLCEIKTDIGNLKADIGYLKGRIDSLDRGGRN